MKDKRIDIASFVPLYSPETTAAVYTLYRYFFTASPINRFTGNRDAANAHNTLYALYNNEIKTLQLPK